MKFVQVGMGLILDDQDRVLMALRRHTQSRPCMWEIPGGRVEEGERVSDAVIRELKEELDVEVEIVNVLDVCNLILEVELHMTIFVVRIISGEPKPLESAELKWTTMDYAIVNLPCVPSTYIFYRSITEYIHNRVR